MSFHYEARLRGRVRLLRRLGFLIPEAEARRKRSRIAAWGENVASAFHQCGVERSPVRARRVGPPNALARERCVRTAVQRCSSATARFHAVVLPAVARAGADLEADARQRAGPSASFAAGLVSLADLAAVVGGTFGRTGSHDGGFFGSLLTKTSPSAGSLHPIECYVLAWNVRGLDPGLYHYDVAPTSFGGCAGRLPRRGRARRLRPGLGGPCRVSVRHDRRHRAQPLEVRRRGRPTALSFSTPVISRRPSACSRRREGSAPSRPRRSRTPSSRSSSGSTASSEFPVYLCGAGVPVW